MAAVIKIQIESTGSVQEVKKDVADLGRTAEESGKGFSALKEIGIGALREIGSAAIDLAAKGFQAVAGAISDGIADAKQNAQIQAQTAAVLKSTGDAAGVSAQHIMDYASSLSDAAGKSLFGDDQIQQSTNLLLTFTNIKGATLDAATAISVDMAQALGGAPKDAAIQLGKALNDPIKGITALTRVGVTFSDEQKAMIQAMTEAGDTAGAQKVILDELNKEFGGSAQAAAAATGGWSEFNGRLGEAKEALGAAVLPLLNNLAGILNTVVLPAIENFAAWFTSVQPAIQAFINDGIDQIEAGLSGLNDIWLSANDATSSWAETIGFLFDALLGLQTNGIGPLQGVLITLNDAWQSANDATSSWAEQIGFVLDALLGLQQGIGPLQTAGIAMQDMFTSLRGTFASLSATFSDAKNPVEGLLNVLSRISPTFAIVRGMVEAALPPIKDIVLSVFGIISGFIAEHGAKIKSDITTAWHGIQTLINAVLPPIQSIISSIFGAVATFLHEHGADIQSFLGKTWDQIAAIIKVATALIQAIIVPVFQFIAKFLTDHGTEIQRILSNTWNAIKAVIDIALTLIQGILTVALDIIKGDWSGAWDTIKATFSQIWDDIKVILGAAWDNIKTLFGGFAKQALDFGANIIQGIIDGISNGVGALTNAISNAAQHALDAAKHALGISSPSKEFFKIGYAMPEGWAQGIMQGAPMVHAAVAHTSGGAINTATTINNHLNFQPNYSGGNSEKLDFAFAKSLAGVI